MNVFDPAVLVTAFLAGLLGSLGMKHWSEYAQGVSLGTLVTTFLVWVLLIVKTAMTRSPASAAWTRCCRSTWAAPRPSCA